MAQITGFGPLSRFSNRVDEAIKTVEATAEQARVSADAAAASAEAAKAAADSLKDVVNLMINTAKFNTEENFAGNLYQTLKSSSVVS